MSLSIPYPKQDFSQFERLTNSTEAVHSLFNSWNASQKTPELAREILTRARELHREHDDCYQRCLMTSLKPAWWTAETPSQQREVNQTIVRLERILKYTASNEPFFPIPELSEAGEPGYTTRPIDQEWRRAIWVDQHAFHVNLPRWLMDATKPLNEEWKLVMQCRGSLVLWGQSIREDTEKLATSGPAQVQEYVRWWREDEGVVDDVDRFVTRCEGSDAVEFDKCYDQWVRDMLHRLVRRYQEGVRLRRSMGLEVRL